MQRRRRRWPFPAPLKSDAILLEETKINFVEPGLKAEKEQDPLISQSMPTIF